ncbi:hypothetical protein [Xanthomonas hortorum]|uniref:hypothetical protein n=1 Tax=Xanthomonas hortorum TaxID=56454 RepID=UPI001C7D32C6|nr:hypothetical protein [Xanthomonas hortorum]
MTVPDKASAAAPTVSDTLMASRNLVVFNLIFLSESPNGGKQRNASASEVMRARIDCDIVGERIKLRSHTGKRPGEERSEKTLPTRC